MDEQGSKLQSFPLVVLGAVLKSPLLHLFMSAVCPPRFSPHLRYLVVISVGSSLVIRLPTERSNAALPGVQRDLVRKALKCEEPWRFAQGTF